MAEEWTKKGDEYEVTDTTVIRTVNVTQLNDFKKMLEDKITRLQADITRIDADLAKIAELEK